MRISFPAALVLTLSVVTGVVKANDTKFIYCAANSSNQVTFQNQTTTWKREVTGSEIITSEPPVVLDGFSIVIRANYRDFYPAGASATVTYVENGLSHVASAHETGPFEGRPGNVIDMTVINPASKRLLQVICAFAFQPEFSQPPVPPVVTPRP